MNFKYFDKLLERSAYDEIKVLGKDIVFDGHHAHLIGMTLKEKQACVYALEAATHSDPDEEQEIFSDVTDKTRRQEMRETYACEMDISMMRIREFHANGKIYETAGATASAADHANMPEHLLLYLLMREHGWKMPEESPLYEPYWECLQLSVIELRDEMDTLPDWGNDLEIVIDSHPKTKLLEIPVDLSLGETPVIPFHLDDGTPAKCYINNIYLDDVWADHEHRLTDEEYKKRMLEHMSEKEFQEMMKRMEAALLNICSRGKCYMIVEYECSADLSLEFYASSYLDSIPEVHSGSASSLLMIHHPDKKEGTHGLPLHGCVIQTPLDPDTSSLKAELFLYRERIKQKSFCIESV